MRRGSPALPLPWYHAAWRRGVERLFKARPPGEERGRMAVRSHAEHHDIEGGAEACRPPARDRRGRFRSLGRLIERNETRLSSSVLEQVVGNRRWLERSFSGGTKRSSTRVTVTFDQSSSRRDSDRKKAFGVEPPDTARLAVPLAAIAAASLAPTSSARASASADGFSNMCMFALMIGPRSHRSKCGRRARSARSTGSGPRFRRYILAPAVRLLPRP